MPEIEIDKAQELEDHIAALEARVAALEAALTDLAKPPQQEI